MKNFNVDPTFNQIHEEVTPIVYSDLSVNNKKTKGSRTFLGPTMLHHHKDEQTYGLLASTAVTSCKGIESVKSFVTNGEEALIKAFKKELPRAVPLHCFRDFQMDCLTKLRNLSIKGNDQNTFINYTFGKDGIVDSTDSINLRVKLDSLKKVMDMTERKILQKGWYCCFN